MVGFSNFSPLCELQVKAFHEGMNLLHQLCVVTGHRECDRKRCFFLFGPNFLHCHCWCLVCLAHVRQTKTTGQRWLMVAASRKLVSACCVLGVEQQRIHCARSLNLGMGMCVAFVAQWGPVLSCFCDANLKDMI